MAEIVCGTCGTNDGTHERWCAVGHRIAEIAEKDRRIAELEATLKELQIEFFEHQEDPQRSVTYKWSLTRIGYALAGSPSSLDAALAAAKREALEAGIKFCMETAELNRRASRRMPMYDKDESQSIFRELAQEDEVIMGELRRMQREVKP